MVKKVDKKSEQKVEMKKMIPTGVQNIAFICFGLSVLFFLFAGSSFFYADIAGLVPADELLAQGIEVSTGQMISMGVLYLIFSVIFYYLGRQLLAGNNRARGLFIAVVLVFVGMIIYASVAQDIFLKYFVLFVVVTVGYLLWYLTKQEVRDFFK